MKKGFAGLWKQSNPGRSMVGMVGERDSDSHRILSDCVRFAIVLSFSLTISL
jgi:hypothetical protein